MDQDWEQFFFSMKGWVRKNILHSLSSYFCGARKWWPARDLSIPYLSELLCGFWRHWSHFSWMILFLIMVLMILQRYSFSLVLTTHPPLNFRFKLPESALDRLWHLKWNTFQTQLISLPWYPLPLFVALAQVRNGKTS